MKYERSFLRCGVCGNIVGIIEDGGVTPECCGEEMQPMVPNTVEAAVEKHLPVITRNGNQVTVSVGSAPHPMAEEHFIGWIALAQQGHTQRISLQPGAKPEAVFTAGAGPVSVYSYCNLHGLWAAEG